MIRKHELIGRTFIFNGNTHPDMVALTLVGFGTTMDVFLTPEEALYVAEKLTAEAQRIKNERAEGLDRRKS